MTKSPQHLPSSVPTSFGINDTRAPSMLPIITFVLWILTCVVGSIGLRLGYPQPQPVVPRPPVQTHLVNVDVPKSPLPPREAEPPLPNPSPVAALPDIPAVPAAPALPEAPPVAVAQPSPAIAFALPVEGFTKIVDVSQAAHARPTITGQGIGPGNGSAPPLPPAPTHASAAPAATPSAITHLTLGQGEGNQPAPDYPHDAVVGHQEGTVTLRFNVDETGRVTKVEVTTACKWSLLNKAASNTIKERWHFPPGQPRTYEVPIQFQLNQE